MNETEEKLIDGVLVLERTFHAPREAVFRAWTESGQFQKWWGPECFTNPVCEIDARFGGSIRVDMAAPDGTVYPMGGAFREIVAPEKVVFTTTAFPQEDGSWWIENLNTVTLATEGSGTRLRLEARILKCAPEAAGAIEGMPEGWKQSLVKLKALLEGG